MPFPKALERLFVRASQAAPSLGITADELTDLALLARVEMQCVDGEFWIDRRYIADKAAERTSAMESDVRGIRQRMREAGHRDEEIESTIAHYYAAQQRRGA